MSRSPVRIDLGTPKSSPRQETVNVPASSSTTFRNEDDGELFTADAEDDAGGDFEAEWMYTTPATRRQPFFSLRPRAIPSISFFAATILYLYVAGERSQPKEEKDDKSQAPGSAAAPASLQTIINLVITAAMVAIKSLWIPNPKDDVLAGGSLLVRAKRYGFVGAAWHFSTFTILYALRIGGPIPVVSIQAILPLLVLGFVKGFSSKSIAVSAALDQHLMGFLLAVVVGIISMATALEGSASLNTLGVMAALIGVSCHAASLVWMEKYMVEVETDAWVLALNVSLVSCAFAVVTWLFAGLPLPEQTGWTFTGIRTGVWAGTVTVATTFLIQHISSFSFSLLTLLCDTLFVIFYWQTRGLSMSWFGAIGFLMLVGGLHFLHKKTNSRSTENLQGAYMPTAN